MPPATCDKQTCACGQARVRLEEREWWLSERMAAVRDLTPFEVTRPAELPVTHRYLSSDYQPSAPRWIVILALTLCLALTEVEEGSAGQDASSFCGSPIVRDYEGPLRDLPDAEPLPSMLPFGPSGLRTSWFVTLKPAIAATSVADPLPGKELRYLGDLTGFPLRNDSDLEMTLNWKIRMSISRVGVDGEPSSLISERTTDVGALRPRESFWVLDFLREMGTVRIDLLFFDAEGDLLGGYFEYARVVPFRPRARLRLSRHAMPPGGKFALRVENLGTTEVNYGLPYRLQVYKDDRWQQAPQRENFFAPRHGLRPGRASHCQHVRISKQAEPGLYRISKKVGSWERRQGKKVFLFKHVTETFRVTSPPASR